jgi:tetratricopeptide (TPR) repeat protein
LQAREEILGPKHTTTLEAIGNLALLYEKQLRLEEAAVLYERALQGKEEVLGPNHLSTLHTVGGLGNLYRRLEDGKAEAMLVRALQGNKEALGSEHVWTLDTSINLYTFYDSQGRFAEARELGLKT